MERRRVISAREDRQIDTPGVDGAKYTYVREYVPQLEERYPNRSRYVPGPRGPAPTGAQYPHNYQGGPPTAEFTVSNSHKYQPQPSTVHLATPSSYKYQHGLSTDDIETHELSSAESTGPRSHRYQHQPSTGEITTPGSSHIYAHGFSNADYTTPTPYTNYHRGSFKTDPAASIISAGVHGPYPYGHDPPQRFQDTQYVSGSAPGISPIECSLGHESKQNSSHFQGTDRITGNSTMESRSGNVQQGNVHDNPGSSVYSLPHALDTSLNLRSDTNSGEHQRTFSEKRSKHSLPQTHPASYQFGYSLDKRPFDYAEHHSIGYHQSFEPSDVGAPAQAPVPSRGPPPAYNDACPEMTDEKQQRDTTMSIDEPLDLNWLLKRLAAEPNEAVSDLLKWTYHKGKSDHNLSCEEVRDIVNAVADFVEGSAGNRESNRAVIEALGIVSNICTFGAEARITLRGRDRLLTELIRLLRMDEVLAGKLAAAVASARTIQNISYNFAESSQATSDNATQNIGWFGVNNKKKKKAQAKHKDTTSQDTVRYFKCSEGMSAYIEILENGSSPDLLTAVMGILQNLSAGDSQAAADFRDICRKEKLLPVLIEIASCASSEELMLQAYSTLLNLIIDARNQELLSKYAMKQSVQSLPLSLDGKQTNTCPVARRARTKCVILALVWELISASCFASSALESGLVPRAVSLATNIEEPMNVKCYAAEVLSKMWSYKSVRSSYKVAGWPKDKMCIRVPGSHTLDPEEIALDVPSSRFSDLVDVSRYNPSDVMNEYHDVTRDGGNPNDVTDHRSGGRHLDAGHTPHGLYEPPPAYNDVMK